MKGVCDVVVADGFTGNAVLKAIEGTALAVMSLLKDTIANAGAKGKLGALLLKDDLKSIKGRMDQAQYGGAVLLGVKAPVVKAHGSSDDLTVYYTLKQIRTMIHEEMVPNFTKYWQVQQAKEVLDSKDAEQYDILVCEKLGQVRLISMTENEIFTKITTIIEDHFDV